MLVGICLGIGQLLLGLGKLCFGLRQGISGILELGFSIFQECPVVINLLLTVTELVFCFGKFLIRFVLAVFVIRKTLLVFCQTIFILGLRIGLQGLIPGLGKLLEHRLQFCLGPVHCLIQGSGIDLMIPIQSHADLSIVVSGEGFCRDKNISSQTTIANGSCTTGHIHIQRGADIAYNSKCRFAHVFQCIGFIGIGQDELLTQNGIRCMGAVYQTFIRLPGHSSAQQIHPVHRFRDGVQPVDLLFTIIKSCDHILGDGSFCRCNAFKL